MAKRKKREKSLHEYEDDSTVKEHRPSLKRPHVAMEKGAPGFELTRRLRRRHRLAVLGERAVMNEETKQ